MIDIAVISGSGFYDFPGLAGAEKREIATKFGTVIVSTGRIEDKKVAFIARHGQEHQFLPNLINYRANVLALKELDSKAILSTTVCGVLESDIPLAKPVVFSDLYFPDNRFPSGELCSIYGEEGLPGRGHFIFSQPFSETLRQQLITAAEDPIADAVYAHVNGPRFNSKPEIRALQSHASFVSQSYQLLGEYTWADNENPIGYENGSGRGYFALLTFNVQGLWPVASYQHYDYEDPFHGEAYLNPLFPGLGISKDLERWALGVVYILSQTAFFKLEYQFNREKGVEIKNDMLLVQVAVSF